ncbi:tachykinins [Hyalella azteca]|uniref:Tachykinins n=1 Tax=Hyalella azteca TaxID=294128 RepID=A0A8B7PL95_HYAAZ|nr:tachykinins [Hyalella azteca]
MKVFGRMIAHPALLLLVSSCVVLASVAERVPYDGPLTLASAYGRGYNEGNALTHDLDEPPAGGDNQDLQELRGSKVVSPNFIHYKDKDTSGMMGLRDPQLDEEELEQAYGEDDVTYADMRNAYGPVGVREKKTPRGFVGLRGKKAPSGFLGVRGKKEAPQNLGDLLRALSLQYQHQSSYKRAPLGFIGMRGRRTDTASLHELHRAGVQSGPGRGSTPLKRAPPQYGFIGLRG